MPNRLGIVHVRDSFDQTKKLAEEEVSSICEKREKAFENILKKATQLKDDEAAKLGLKVESDEIEKFVSSNCQEVSKDKWLCPLSGKKFKAPDFVKKHIQNKFPEKIEEVKLKTQFFNNYIKDPKRPELPEKPKESKPKPQLPRPDPIEPPYPDALDDGPPMLFQRQESRKRSVQDRLGR